MFVVEESALQAIRDHAAAEAPRECCGVILVRKGRQVYYPCHNVAVQGEGNFHIKEQDYMEAEASGEIVAIVHSHPFTPPVATEADLVGVENSELPWVIVNHPLGTVGVFEPNGYEAPLVGRQFFYGVLDCYSLVRDYYKRELGIEMTDYAREPDWWEHGGNMYIDHYKEEGFYPVPLEQIRKHDVILFTHQSKVPNHAAVFVGEGQILHHLSGRLSSRDTLGGYWEKAIYQVFRHESEPC